METSKSSRTANPRVPGTYGKPLLPEAVIKRRFKKGLVSPAVFLNEKFLNVPGFGFGLAAALSALWPW